MNTAATPPDGLLNPGMIGNCAISALIDDHARMVWCCLPRFDGDPVFNALLQPGDEGSHFAIELEDLASAHQWYEPNTAILRTQLFDKAGHGIEITDFAPRFYSRSRYFRPMTLCAGCGPSRGRRASGWRSRCATTGARPRPRSRAAATTSAMWARA